VKRETVKKLLSNKSRGAAEGTEGEKQAGGEPPSGEAIVTQPLYSICAGNRGYIRARN